MGWAWGAGLFAVTSTINVTCEFWTTCLDAYFISVVVQHTRRSCKFEKCSSLGANMHIYKLTPYLSKFQCFFLWRYSLILWWASLDETSKWGEVLQQQVAPLHNYHLLNWFMSAKITGNSFQMLSTCPVLVCGEVEGIWDLKCCKSGKPKHIYTSWPFEWRPPAFCYGPTKAVQTEPRRWHGSGSRERRGRTGVTKGNLFKRQPSRQNSWCLQ